MNYFVFTTVAMVAEEHLWHEITHVTAEFVHTHTHTSRLEIHKAKYEFFTLTISGHWVG